MAFTPEDGTGLAAANAYADVAYVDAYLADRGGQANDQWSGLNAAEKEDALVRATDYIESRFSGRFVGIRKTQAQGLSWPRTYAYDADGFALASDEVPDAVKQATAEYAHRASRINLLPDPLRPYEQTAEGSSVTAQATGPIKRKRSKAGPVESETEYGDVPPSSGLANSIPAYPAADAMLRRVVHLTGSRTLRL